MEEHRLRERPWPQVCHRLGYDALSMPAGRCLLLLLLAACPRPSEPQVAPVDAGIPYAVDCKPEGDKQRIEIEARAGFHLNAEYPANFKPQDGGRIELNDIMEKLPCPGDPSHNCAASACVPRVDGVVAFSICSKDTCLIEKVPVRTPAP
jgi:hypothetical protein